MALLEQRTIFFRKIRLYGKIDSNPHQIVFSSFLDIMSVQILLINSLNI